LAPHSCIISEECEIIQNQKWREMKDVRVFSLARSVTLKENCGLEFQERRGIEGQF
jgi:hypothetical protein